MRLEAKMKIINSYKTSVIRQAPGSTCVGIPIVLDTIFLGNEVLWANLVFYLSNVLLDKCLSVFRDKISNYRLLCRGFLHVFNEMQGAIILEFIDFSVQILIFWILSTSAFLGDLERWGFFFLLVD